LDASFAEPALAKISEHMAILNARLGEVPYLAGDEYSIPDIVLAPTAHSLCQMAGTDEIIAAQTNIIAWYDRVRQRPGFIKVHSKN